MERILAEYQVSKDPRGKTKNHGPRGVDLVEAEWDVLIEHSCGERNWIQLFKYSGCGPVDTAKTL